MCANSKVFAGCDSVIDLTSSDSRVPSGIIAMWSGSSSNIPLGWLLCNGDNGTPDLRNRFIVGAGASYSPGNTGGSDSVTLTINQIAAHTHSHNFSISLDNITCSASGEHDHEIPMAINEGTYGTWPMKARTSSHSEAKTASSGSHTHTITGSGSLSGSISSTGGGQSHENRPPYYALCFIMKE